MTQCRACPILDDLGYSVADNLVSDVVVLVEGPTDTPVLEEPLLKKGVLPKFDVKIWPLGGDVMDQLDLSLLTQAYKVVALLDRDPGSGKVRKRFRERCKESGIPVVQLKRYAIENYGGAREREKSRTLQGDGLCTLLLRLGV